MGDVRKVIDQEVADFIQQQHVFFVATAPLSGEGHVNLSPKGLDSFVILDGRTVAYLDLVGSGVETIAHLRENGRIVILFCAFEGPAQIYRLHGRGDVLEPGDAEFEKLSARFPARPGVRSVIRVTCDRISESCGYGVPLYAFQGERTQLIEWAEKMGSAGLHAWRREHNRESLDGLPGLA